MLYICLLEDLITDANTEEESTISITDKEEFPTGLFFFYWKTYLYLQLDLWFMMPIATFDNIPVTDKLYHSKKSIMLYRVHLAMNGVRTHNFSICS